MVRLVLAAISVLSSDAHCPPCDVELEAIVVVGDTTGPGIIESTTVVAARTRTGELILATGFGQEFKIFDPSGVYRRSIGRSGEGPGEFRSIAAIEVGPADSIFVFDDVLGRVSVYSPVFVLARTFLAGVRLQTRAVVMQNAHHIVLAAFDRSPERIGFPLHIIDRIGQPVRSFGSNELLTPGPSTARQRIIAASSRGRFWAGRTSEYLIEEWSTDGTRLRGFRRNVEWFPPQTEPPQPDGLRKPPPVLSAISIMDDGQLIVAIQRSVSNWKDFVRAGADHVEYTDEGAIRETVIEIIDADSLRVIASGVFPESIYAFVGDGVAVSVSEDEHGNPRVAIVRIVLKPARR